jgi:hypothetical protein
MHDLNNDDIEQSVLDEILKYAEGKQASDLKSRYAPPEQGTDGQPIPGVDAEPDDDEADAGAAPDADIGGDATPTDLTPEQIAQLEALLSQAK